MGLAPNKFLAKIASDLEKPEGFVVVDPDRISVDSENEAYRAKHLLHKPIGLLTIHKLLDGNWWHMADKLL